MTIYDRIKQLREQQGLSQQALAEKVGFKTASAINKIELGLRDINQKKVILFAKALNTTPAYLMGWEDKQEECNSPKPKITENIDKHINIIKIAGRDGSYEERALTDEQLELFKKMINALPEATDL